MGQDVLVCPIIALSVYLSTFNMTCTKDSAPFPVDNQYKQFTDTVI